MSIDPIDPLDTDLADLLRREGDAYPVDAALRERVFAKVEMAVVLGGGGSGPRGSGSPPGQAGAAKAAATTGAAGAAKTALLGKFAAVGVAAFVAGGVVGGTVATSVTRAPVAVGPESGVEAPRPLPPSANEDDSGVRLAPSVPSSPLAEGPATVPATPPGPSAASSSPPTTGSSGHDLTRERELLDVAQAALARGRPDDAVLAAERHAARWPHGELAEEREVVLIEALVAAGHRPEADQRAAKFRKAFPSSMLAPAINKVLGVDAGE
jgi:hypothetical protein